MSSALSTAGAFTAKEKHPTWFALLRGVWGTVYIKNWLSNLDLRVLRLSVFDSIGRNPKIFFIKFYADEVPDGVHACDARRA